MEKQTVERDFLGMSVELFHRMHTETYDLMREADSVRAHYQGESPAVEEAMRMVLSHCAAIHEIVAQQLQDAAEMKKKMDSMIDNLLYAPPLFTSKKE